MKLEHPSMRPPRLLAHAASAQAAPELPQFATPPAIVEIRRHEAVMAELLVAAQAPMPKRLSRLAEEAVGGPCAGKSAGSLTAVAVALRDRCVALGMPACRYREPDWRLRGMPIDGAEPRPG